MASSTGEGDTTKVYKSGRQDHLVGADVLIVGLFSAERKDYEVVMEAVAKLATARGARVLGRIVQRRGVSDGGVVVMARQFSRRTLVTGGKVRGIADRCQADQIGAVILVNPLTDRRCQILEEQLGCPVLSRTEMETLVEPRRLTPVQTRHILSKSRFGDAVIQHSASTEFTRGRSVSVDRLAARSVVADSGLNQTRCSRG